MCNILYTSSFSQNVLLVSTRHNYWKPIPIYTHKTGLIFADKKIVHSWEDESVHDYLLVNIVQTIMKCISIKFNFYIWDIYWKQIQYPLLPYLNLPKNFHGRFTHLPNFLPCHPLLLLCFHLSSIFFVPVLNLNCVNECLRWTSDSTNELTRSCRNRYFLVYRYLLIKLYFNILSTIIH